MNSDLVLGVFDRPVWSDWLFWVTVVLAVGGSLTQLGLFALIFNFVLFGIIGGMIRNAVRKRRSPTS